MLLRAALPFFTQKRLFSEQDRNDSLEDTDSTYLANQESDSLPSRHSVISNTQQNPRSTSLGASNTSKGIKTKSAPLIKRHVEPGVIYFTDDDQGEDDDLDQFNPKTSRVSSIQSYNTSQEQSSLSSTGDSDYPQSADTDSQEGQVLHRSSSISIWTSWLKSRLDQSNSSDPSLESTSTESAGSFFDTNRWFKEPLIVTELRQQIDAYPAPTMVYGYPYLWYHFLRSHFYPEDVNGIEFDPDSGNHWEEKIDQGVRTFKSYLHRDYLSGIYPPTYLPSYDSLVTGSKEWILEHTPEWVMSSWLFLQQDWHFDWHNYYSPACVWNTIHISVFTWALYNLWAFRLSYRYIRLRRKKKRAFRNWWINLPTLIKVFPRMKRHRRRRYFYLIPFFGLIFWCTPIFESKYNMDWPNLIRDVQGEHRTIKSDLHILPSSWGHPENIIQTPEGQTELIHSMILDMNAKNERERMEEIEEAIEQDYYTREEAKTGNKATMEKSTRRERRLQVQAEREKLKLFNSRNHNSPDHDVHSKLYPIDPETGCISSAMQDEAKAEKSKNRSWWWQWFLRS